MMRAIGLAFVLSVVACSRGDDSGKPSGSGAPGAVSVGLSGVHPPGSVLVRMESIELLVDGKALPAQLEGGEIDLGNDQTAWTVMTFGLPTDAHKIAVTLHFQPEGVVLRNGKKQALDLNGPPLSLAADAVQLRTHDKAVLDIDLAQSLIDRGEQVFFIPSFTVRY